MAVPTESHADVVASFLRSGSEAHRTTIALAADVADAVLSLADADVPPGVRTRLTAIIERADQTRRGVPVSVAARLLGITQPTTRTWIERGALAVVEGSRPLAVTTRSLGEAIAATSTIRRIARDARLLRRVLDVLDDQRTRHDLEGRIDELGSRVPVDPDRIDQELFS